MTLSRVDRTVDEIFNYLWHHPELGPTMNYIEDDDEAKAQLKKELAEIIRLYWR